MLNEKSQSHIKDLAEQVSAREGCILYDIEFIGQSSARILRVFIDKESEPVGIDDCSRVSHGLDLLLDVDDIVPGGSYNLEVSSPGLDRPLKQKWHFAKAIGKKIYVRSQKPMQLIQSPPDYVSNRKQITGELTVCDDQGIELNLGQERWRIEFDNIEKSHVVFEMESNNKQKKNKKGVR